MPPLGPPRAPAKPAADDDEVAADPLGRNPLWRSASEVEDDELSEAPTARLGPSASARDGEPTIRLPAPADMDAGQGELATDPKVAERAVSSPPAASVGAEPSAGPGGIPLIAWLAVGAAAALFALIVVYLVVG